MPLSVALVSEHASPLAEPGGGPDAGGQNVYVRDLAATLARRGHRVTVYTRRTSVDQPRTVRGAFDVVHVPAGPAAELPKEELAVLMGEFGDQLALLWRNDPPDVVHAHYYMSGTAVLGGVRRTGIPVVQTFHALADDKIRFLGDAAPRTESERLGAERTIAHVADHIVALTTAEASRLAALFRVPAGRVTVVPCGVDLARFHRRGPMGPGSRLITVGRLVARKGVDALLAALRLLPEAELMIAGGPPEPELAHDSEYIRLRREADRLGVTDRVRFLGQVAHARVPNLLSTADVFVCAPGYEPFGMAALEAAASGLPVVATDVGGLRETVIDGVTGFLAPDAEPETLASRLRPLLADPGLRSEFGAAGARHATRFDWNRVADELLSVYETIRTPPNFQ